MALTLVMALVTAVALPRQWRRHWRWRGAARTWTHQPALAVGVGLERRGATALHRGATMAAGIPGQAAQAVAAAVAVWVEVGVTMVGAAVAATRTEAVVGGEAVVGAAVGAMAGAVVAVRGPEVEAAVLVVAVVVVSGLQSMLAHPHHNKAIACPAEVH